MLRNKTSRRLALAAIAGVLTTSAVATARWVMARGRSQAYNSASAAELQAIVGDGRRPKAARIEALFALFANHCRLPASAVDLAEVLKPDSWLDESSVEGIVFMAGLLPVLAGPDDDTFELYPFADTKGLSDVDPRPVPMVYFTLSGGRGGTVSAAREFLQGRARPDVRMIEFALCFGSPDGRGRVHTERFTAKGMSVFSDG